MPAHGWAAAGTSSCSRRGGDAMQVLWHTEAVGRHRACCRGVGPTASGLDFASLPSSHRQYSMSLVWPTYSGRRKGSQRSEAASTSSSSTRPAYWAAWPRTSWPHVGGATPRCMPGSDEAAGGRDNGQPPLCAACPAPPPLNRASQWADPPLAAVFNHGAAWPERLCVAARPGQGAGGASACFGCGRGRRAAASRLGGGRPCTLAFAGANSWQLGVAHGPWGSASVERELWRLAGWLPLPTRPPVSSAGGDQPHD